MLKWTDFCSSYFKGLPQLLCISSRGSWLGSSDGCIKKECFLWGSPFCWSKLLCWSPGHILCDHAISFGIASLCGGVPGGGYWSQAYQDLLMVDQAGLLALSLHVAQELPPEHHHRLCLNYYGNCGLLCRFSCFCCTGSAFKCWCLC